MTYQFPTAGTVAYAQVAGGPFRSEKDRPIVFLNDRGLAAPLTSTGRARTQIDPTGTNGLTVTSGVITDIRVLVYPDADIDVVGQMSAAELAVIRAAVRYGFVLIVDVK